jgi:hypothetical protein
MNASDFRFKPRDCVVVGEEVYRVLWREQDHDECTPALERGWYAVEREDGKRFRVRDSWLHRGRSIANDTICG